MPSRRQRQRTYGVESLVGWVTEMVRRQTWRRGLAFGLPSFALALGLRLALEGFMHNRPFGFFIPPVLLAVLVGGAAPGIAMGVLSALTGWYFFVAPYRSFALPSAQDGVTMLFVWLVMAALVLLVAALSRSIRAQVAAQDLARAAAEARGLMFHELQHRVANNLQFVSALLGLAASQVSSAEEGRAALKDAQRRLQQMAQLHRWLHDPEAGERDLPALLGTICEHLRDATGQHGARFDLAVDRVTLPGESLTAVALLVNEAVTNALKHASDQPLPLVVKVCLHRQGESLELTVQDNGPGLPEPVGQQHERGRRGSLGLRVMAALASQLGGRLDLANAGGTLVRVRFPLSAQAAAA